MRLIAGSIQDRTSPVPVYSNLFYLNGSIGASNKFSYEFPEGIEAAIYLLKGRIKVEDQIKTRFDMIVFKKDTRVEFEALSDCDFMFFGGETFPEKRNIYWNFVSTSNEKIEEAKRRWENKEFPKTIDE